jgi:tetratricopeptide (TPR) repeat protein
VNLLVHVANVLLVFSILLRLSGGTWAAFLGALLFAVHPVAVESVAWISEFKGLAACLFCLASTRLYLDHVRPGPGRLGRHAFVLSFLAFILALLCKPTAAVLPFLLPVLAWAMAGWPLSKGFTDMAPWLLALLPFGLVSMSAQPNAEIAYKPPLALRPFVALDALAFYLGKLAWPADLAVDYGRTPQLVLGQWWGYATWLPVAALAAVLARARRLRFLLPAFLLFCLGFLPILGIKPFMFQAYSTVADRYMYLPMLGPALGVALVAARTRSRGAHAAILASLLLLAGLTARHLPVWHDEFSLYEHTLRLNPRSSLAYCNLGAAEDAAGQPDKALAHMLRALELNPASIEANINLAHLMLRTKRYEEAAERYAKVLELVPGYSLAHLNLATALLRLGRTDQAVEHGRAAVRLRPRNPQYRFDLGNILAEAGRPDEAAGEFQEAVRLKPAYAEAHTNLGTLLRRAGDCDGASRHYAIALRLRPGDASIASALARCRNGSPQEPTGAGQ